MTVPALVDILLLYWIVMVSLDNVARAAGVSKSVASRALNGDVNARIREETRTRILEIADQLGYVPNRRAIALRFNRSGAIALIVPDPSNHVFAEMLAGIQEVATPAGIDVLVGNVDHAPEGRDAVQRLLKQGRVDGILIQRREDFDDDELREVVPEGIPTVFVNCRLDDRIGSVILPDIEGVRIATEHLIDLGHRDLGFIGGSPLHDAAIRRRIGFEETLASHGLVSRPEWVQEFGWEAPDGAAAVDAILGRPDRPTGLVVASVNAAVGALSRLQRAQVKVPEEMSIVGIHTTWVSETVFPAITTVRMPLSKIGSRAAEMLLGYLDGGALSDVTIDDPAPELLVRGTSVAPAKA
ncbi:LacI family DNA-binding transcriptional regulator [Nocardia carnea]|uniref:LacI family DNA-binding transcriptional regulator n=2 Tax=Nocardia carnea TaxID=37328 RepID=UPI002455E38F|nr:LacI family DNA-binding transcriptional regulator [Nocardia carnea]